MMFSPHLLDRSATTSDEPRAACAGLWDLFDQTDRPNHIAARNICGGCDLIAACRANLRDEMRRLPGGRPIGTWAGELYTNEAGAKSRRSRRVA